jgi:hypothetical protein
MFRFGWLVYVVLAVVAVGRMPTVYADNPCPITDLDGDCRVNLSDFVVFADNWLRVGLNSPICHDAKRVYLLAGQSNMAGAGLVADLPAEWLLKQSDVQIYAGGQVASSGHWEALGPGMGSNQSCIGPELSFGHDIAAIADPCNTYLIKHAVGGTNLYDQWHAPDNTYPNGGVHYQGFISTVRAGLGALLNDCYEPNIAGMLWMQGESDGNSGLAAAQAYKQNLIDLIQSIRSDLGVPNMPFVIGQISNNYGIIQYGTIIQQAQLEVSQEVPNTALVITSDLPIITGEGVVPVHYTAAGQIELGKRFADKLIPKGNFNSNIKVDFIDFAELASDWLGTE